MPKRIVKRKTSSGAKFTTHLKVAAVVNAVSRLVTRHKSAPGCITAFIPDRLQVGNPVIIELTFPASGQTFAMQGKVRAIERRQTAGQSLDECPALSS